MSWASRVKERSPITLDDLIEGAVERAHADWLQRPEGTLDMRIAREVKLVVNAFNEKQTHDKSKEERRTYHSTG